MPSIRASLVKFMLQHRHWVQGQLKKEVIDWSKYESIISFREQVEKGAGKFGKLPEGIEVSPIKIGDLQAEWVEPSGVTKDRVILYFHGGGYVSGTCQVHRSIVARFVKGSGLPALLFEYGLAPENPYPAAVDDSLAAYKWLLDKGISPSKIVFVGDSAGGGLVLAALLAIRDREIALPAAAVAYSPVTDFKCTGESHRTKIRVCLSPEGSTQAFGRHYAGEYDLELPYISPLYGDLEGLPPLLIYVGEDEVLRDDSIRFAQKAGKAGVETTLRVGEGLFHCYPAMSPLFPEAKEAMAEICRFIKQKTVI